MPTCSFYSIALVISVVSFANPAPVVSVASIEASGEKVVMTDQGYSEGRIVQRFEQGTTLLYQSQVKVLRDGFVIQVSAEYQQILLSKPS